MAPGLTKSNLAAWLFRDCWSHCPLKSLVGRPIYHCINEARSGSSKLSKSHRLGPVCCLVVCSCALHAGLCRLLRVFLMHACVFGAGSEHLHAVALGASAAAEVADPAHIEYVNG
jgi:hypothetical protein